VRIAAPIVSLLFIFIELNRGVPPRVFSDDHLLVNFWKLIGRDVDDKTASRKPCGRVATVVPSRHPSAY
jgi:hypothetical protein